MIGGAIELARVHVRYQAVRALTDVSLSFAPGEIHGLVGHNGSGKSTMVRLIAGNQAPTAGLVIWDGQRLAKGSGVPVVHQNLGLNLTMTALENYGISSTFDSRRVRFVIDWRAERRRYESHMQVMGIDIPAEMEVADLSASQRAGIALMRSLRMLERSESQKSKFLVLDEVSSYLDLGDREKLRQVLQAIALTGTGIIFVSHYLEEVLSMCEVVTVLRGGSLVGTYRAAELTKAELTSHMFGEATAIERPAGRDTRARVLEAPTGQRSFSLQPFLDASVVAGEVLGVTGRSGGQQSELADLVFHRLQRASGEEKETVALVPADRLRTGVWLQGSIAENLTISSVRRFRRGLAPRWILQRRKELEFTKRWLIEQEFKVSGPKAEMSELSGGMQQKVLLGRALLASPALLLLHEPTQGIDLRARGDIIRTIRKVAEEGTAVVLVSNEFAEIVDLCDRVVVVREDRTILELRGSGVSEAALAQAV
jgi:ribose transport system ATP-binding protein